MSAMELCPECNAPLRFTREHRWLTNGEIVQASDEHNRVAFMECENLDPLFANIQEISGRPIEKLVVETAKRGIRYYLKAFVPDIVTEQVLSGRLDLKALDDAFMELSRPLGAGRYEFVDMRFERDNVDYYTVSINQPYSILLAAAAHGAAMEAILGYDHDVTLTEIGPGRMNITAFPRRRPDADDSAKQTWPYFGAGKGDFSLEACGTCGGPARLSNFNWQLDKGIVKNLSTGRRMAMLGGGLLDPVFFALESELGESFGRTVVEAQRRFVRTGFYSSKGVGNEGDIRSEFALRGLGNLKGVRVGRNGVTMRMDNASLHLLVVGLIQGLFEMAFGMDSSVDWEMSGEGDLAVQVSPRVMRYSVGALDRA